MATLYDLTTEYAALMAEYDAAEDDARRAEILEMIDAINDDIGDKGEAYARVLRNLQAEEAAYKAEAQRLELKARAARKAMDTLKARLLDGMKRAGATKLQTSIGTWGVQKNPWKVVITDEKAVPVHFKIPQPDTIDRQEILRHFKATGEIINGVEMRQDTGLRFR